VLLSAIADVCHRKQYYEQVVEGSERSKCFLTDTYRNLLPFRPSSPLVPHLATKITCLYSIYNSTRCYNPEDQHRQLHRRENLKLQRIPLFIAESQALKAHHSPSGWIPRPQPSTCTSSGLRRPLQRCTVLWDGAGSRSTRGRRHSDRVQGAAVREADSGASEGAARRRQRGGDTVRGDSRRWAPCVSHRRTAASSGTGKYSPATTPGVLVVATTMTVRPLHLMRM
jgi:hypothetical protein